MGSTSHARSAVTVHVHETADGARLHWEEEGGEGPRVLLVHGGTGTGAYDWEKVRGPLAESHRLMVLDLRGHGRSSDPRRQISLGRVGDDVRSLLKAQGGCDAIIAFSIGASATLALLCEEPTLTRAFVAIGASRTGDPSRVDEFSTGPWPSELKALHHEHGDGEEHWKQLRRAFAISWAEHHVDDAKLANLDLPTLVVCGDRDPIEPVETALALARALPQGELLVLPACGHFASRQRPVELTVAVSGFLARALAE